jgi:formylmethanofuran dehydrogenase subunit E
MLPPLPELLAECERQHGHICPGQVLGAYKLAAGAAGIPL